MRQEAPRRRRAVVLALVVALAVLVPGGWAAAGDDGEERPADVRAQGYYTADTSDALPPILTDEFPPGVVCIVVPEACNEDAQQITRPIDGAVRELEIPGGPVQPVVPGTLPVGMLGGQERYASVLQFAVPEPPDGYELARLELILHEATPALSMESPAFRAAVRAMISQVADGPSPEPFFGVLAAAASGEEALLSPDFPGVEACPVLDAWEPEENQPAEEQPGRDCVFGGSGEADEEGRWRFDLTFAAMAWLDGSLPPEGIMLAPQGPPNLEYGDPDYSTNFLVSYEGAEADDDVRPALVVAYVPEPEPFDDAGFADGDLDDGGTGGAAFDDDFDDGGFDGAGVDDGGFDDGLAASDDAPFDMAEDGEATETVEAPEPEVRDDDAEGAVAAGARRSPGPEDPWYLWLLLPLGASGLWWYARVLETQPAVAAGRAGALRRLVERAPGLSMSR